MGGKKVPDKWPRRSRTSEVQDQGAADAVLAEPEALGGPRRGKTAFKPYRAGPNERRRGEKCNTSFRAYSSLVHLRRGVGERERV